jgi:hypothetical protein
MRGVGSMGFSHTSYSLLHTSQVFGNEWLIFLVSG